MNIIIRVEKVDIDSHLVFLYVQIEANNEKKNQQFNKANGLTHLLAQMRLAVCEKKKSFIFNE